MSTDGTITKTLWQYSDPLPEETMELLRGIASDYRKVKNYVYGKYAGVKNVNRLTPVYGILNEMRHLGLREQLNLPAVYYELAVTDAVTDIKRSWGMVKNKISEKISANENLGEDDRIYLRTVLKLNHVYAAVLNGEEYEMPKKAEGLEFDVKRLNNLLRRLTRRYLTTPESEKTDSFRVSPNGYSYKDGVLYIAGRIPRRRIPIPLRDERTFDRQIQIRIGRNDVALAVPVETRIRKHADYAGTVYACIGSADMLTLSNGNRYGESLESLTGPETERLSGKNRERRRMYTAYVRSGESGNLQKADRIEINNLGRLKYDRQKEKGRRRTETFINSELNRMLEIEKPAKIVITKPVVKNRGKSYSKSANRKQARNFRSFIRERLVYKCRLHSIELAEINSRGTGQTCSVCGAEGKRLGKGFSCACCGLETTAALNTARNIEKKYKGSYGFS